MLSQPSSALPAPAMHAWAVTPLGTETRGAFTQCPDAAHSIDSMLLLSFRTRNPRQIKINHAGSNQYQVGVRSASVQCAGQSALPAVSRTHMHMRSCGTHLSKNAEHRHTWCSLQRRCTMPRNYVSSSAIASCVVQCPSISNDQATHVSAHGVCHTPETLPPVQHFHRSSHFRQVH